MIVDSHAHFEPLKVVEALNLSSAERDAIAGGTAARLFNIGPAA